MVRRSPIHDSSECVCEGGKGGGACVPACLGILTRIFSVSHLTAKTKFAADSIKCITTAFYISVDFSQVLKKEEDDEKPVSLAG